MCLFSAFLQCVISHFNVDVCKCMYVYTFSHQRYVCAFMLLYFPFIFSHHRRRRCCRCSFYCTLHVLVVWVAHTTMCINFAFSFISFWCCGWWCCCCYCLFCFMIMIMIIFENHKNGIHFGITTKRNAVNKCRGLYQHGREHGQIYRSQKTIDDTNDKRNTRGESCVMNMQSIHNFYYTILLCVLIEMRITHTKGRLKANAFELQKSSDNNTIWWNDAFKKCI